MTRLYVDATVLISLGQVGELDHLTTFDGPIVVVPPIQSEVTTQPAAANLETLCEQECVTTTPPVTPADDRAMEILGEPAVNGDVRLIGAVLAETAADESVAVISDDRRVRTVADGLGAQVTGTIGVLVRAVEDGVSPAAAHELLRQLDANGLHMTAALRSRAEELIEDAASE